MLVMLSLSFGPLQRSQEVFLNMDRQNKPLKTIYSSVVSTSWAMLGMTHHPVQTPLIYGCIVKKKKKIVKKIWGVCVAQTGSVDWREERTIKDTFLGLNSVKPSYLSS